jgi:hypothetical protein
LLEHLDRVFEIARRPLHPADRRANLGAVAQRIALEHQVVGLPGQLDGAVGQ